MFARLVPEVVEPQVEARARADLEDAGRVPGLRRDGEEPPIIAADRRTSFVWGGRSIHGASSSWRAVNKDRTAGQAAAASPSPPTDG
jgi:hypothetical protein